MAVATVPQFSAPKLRAALDRTGTPVSRLAIKLGHANAFKIYSYLKGNKTPTLETVYKLAHALGVEVSDLTVEVAL